MTNKDKYLKDEADIKQLAKEIDNFVDKDLDMKYFIPKFFEQEVKPTLTEDERVILKNLNKKYKYIGRMKGEIGEQFYVKDEEGFKHCFCLYNHLFKFTKERRRI